jgi:hypothetical protein
MDNEAGEDLSWFWRGWFYNNWSLDQSVQQVSIADNKATITIANLDKLVMPTIVQLTFNNGTTQRIQLPVETWFQHTSYTFSVPLTMGVTAVTIDPDQQLPDANRKNNVFNLK